MYSGLGIRLWILKKALHGLGARLGSLDGHRVYVTSHCDSPSDIKAWLRSSDLSVLLALYHNVRIFNSEEKSGTRTTFLSQV